VSKTFKNGMKPCHPGRFFREEYFVPLEMNVKSLALLFEMTEADIIAFLHERMPLTEKLAKSLSKWMGTTEAIWHNLQDTYNKKGAVMSRKERIIELLAALGETAEEVAASLKDKWIKGKPQSCADCPISKYLVSEGVGYYVETTQAGITANGNLYLVMSDPRLKGILVFIRAFDMGSFHECREPGAFALSFKNP
jgi:antitoxin HigA-1